MAVQPGRARSLLPAVLTGCATLLACACVAGLGLAGYSFYARSRVTAEPAVEYLLDASPRMALATEGGTRLSVAQAVLAEIIRPASPAVSAGLRVFGTGAVASACQDTRLVVPLALASQPLISTELALLQAGPAADAAMAEAMIAALRDLGAAQGPHTLVVVTGGADSCNPEAGALIAAEAERAGVELELFVVGYQVPPIEAEAIRGLIAQTTGAEYLEAHDRAGLEAILKAIQQRVDNPATLPVAGVLATAQAAVPTTAPTAAAGLTREAAAEIVLDQVLLPDTLDHEAIVFAWPEPLGPDDELAPYAYPPFGLPPEPIDIPSDHWFFWIDDFPNGKFEHPNRYVLVDTLTGVPTVLDEAWWPVLNGEGLWTVPEDYWDADNHIFDNFEGRPGLAAAPTRRAHLARAVESQLAQAGGFGMALVLNGWLPGEPGGADMAIDAQQLHDAFAGAGLLTSYLGPAEGVSVNRLDALTPASFDAFFSANASQLTTGDTLIVYGTGHGGRSPAGSYYQVGFDMEAFQRQLEKLEAGVDVVLVFDGSYGGLAITALLPQADRIITATDANTPAAFDADHPTDPDPADRGSEFSAALAAQFDALGGDPGFQSSAARQAAANGVSVFNLQAALAFSSTLAVDSHAVRGTTAPQMAPPAAFTIAENESPRPEDRLFGSYRVKTSFFAGNREHFFFIALPENPVIEVREGSVIFDGPDPWVDVTGELGTDGAFEAVGTGTVANNPDVKVVFTGTLTADGLRGFYTMGTDGKLPGGRSITYLIEGGPEAVTAPGATSTPPQESVEAFVKSFVSSRQINFVEFLLARLNPAVLKVYGEKTCEAELQRRGADATYAMAIVGVSGPADWDYTVDGRTITIPNVYSVEVDLTAAGQTTRQVTHFALVDFGYLTWFTDCGEPLS